MKIFKSFIAVLFFSIFIGFPNFLCAEDAKKEIIQPKPYPLTTCVTDGEKLGSMGKPYVFNYQGREIKLCCKGCEDDFKKDSAKYIKKLEEAEKSAKK